MVVTEMIDKVFEQTSFDPQQTDFPLAVPKMCGQNCETHVCPKQRQELIPYKDKNICTEQ